MSKKFQFDDKNKNTRKKNNRDRERLIFMPIESEEENFSSDDKYDNLFKPDNALLKRMNTVTNIQSNESENDDQVILTNEEYVFQLLSEIGKKVFMEKKETTTRRMIKPDS